MSFDSTTIALGLGGLAFLAYYLDPFGWDPSGRHGDMGFNGPTGLAASLTVLAVGLFVCFHFGMLNEKSFDTETETVRIEMAEWLEPLEPTAKRLQVGFGELGRLAGEGLSQLATYAREQLDALRTSASDSELAKHLEDSWQRLRAS